MVSPSRRYDHYNSSFLSAPRSTSSDAVELAQRTLWDTRRELGTLRSKEIALISRLKQLGETDSTTCSEVLSSEESKNNVYLKGAPLASTLWSRSFLIHRVPERFIQSLRTIFDLYKSKTRRFIHSCKRNALVENSSKDFYQKLREKRTANSCLSLPC